MQDALFSWPTLVSTALACFVEMVEALTIVLAVAVVRGWRSAWVGAAVAVCVLAALVAVFGPALRFVDLRVLQVIVGTLVLLFGMRWLRKAVLRASGRLPLHDEDIAFDREREAVAKLPQRTRFGVDLPAAATSFNGVLVEGIEVIFIVLAVGTTSQRLLSAVSGAGAALCAVILLGVLLRQPLSRVPENSLKMLVGIMLMSLGTVWIGEAAGIHWPMGDWALSGMAGLYLIVALVAAAALRQGRLSPAQVG